MGHDVVRFKELSERAGIFLDFDGTLSEIVEVPSHARPHEGAVELLAALSDRYRNVTIVSGRSAHQLVDWLGPRLDIWGVHGAERSAAGTAEVVLSPTASPFAASMQRVRSEAEERVRALQLRGVVVEDKAVMVGLHYRAAERPEEARRALEHLARDLAERHQLRWEHGRRAFELRPPVELSKGQVVQRVAAEQDLAAAAFCGDDVVDLPGFDALDELEERGALVMRVAVRSDEAPPDLIDRADVVVEGPAGTLAFLRSLL